MHGPPLHPRHRYAPRPVSWRTVIAALGVSAAIPALLRAVSLSPVGTAVVAATLLLAGGAYALTR